MLQRLEVPPDRAVIAAGRRPGDGLGRSQVFQVVDGAREQRGHAAPGGLAVEPGLHREVDRLRKQQRRIVGGEHRGRVIARVVDVAEVKGVTLEIGRHLRQLLPQGAIGVDAEVRAGDVFGRGRAAAEGLEWMEDADAQAALLGQRLERRPVLGPAEVNGRFAGRYSSAAKRTSREHRPSPKPAAR